MLDWAEQRETISVCECLHLPRAAAFGNLVSAAAASEEFGNCLTSDVESGRSYQPTNFTLSV